jgi:hypothetical protein
VQVEQQVKVYLFDGEGKVMKFQEEVVLFWLALQIAIPFPCHCTL